MNEDVKQKDVTEREIVKANGFAMLFLVLIGYVICIAGYIGCGVAYEADSMVLGTLLVVLTTIGIIVFSIMWGGFHIVNPKESVVLTLFGNYYGTIKTPGYFYTNPFASAIAPTTEENEPSTEISIQGKELSTNLNLDLPKKKEGNRSHKSCI